MKQRYPYALCVLTLFFSVVISEAQAQWYNYNDSRAIGALLNDGPTLWVGLLGGGLIKIDKAGGNKTYYTRANSGLRNHFVNALLMDGNTLWIGTDNGLMKFDKGSNWTAYKPSDETFPNGEIKGMAFDADKNIWLATYGGLVKFSAAGEWTLYDKDNSNLVDNKLTCVSVGTDGAVWAGTVNKGLMKFAGGTFKQFKHSNSGLLVDSVTCINANLRGEIWVGLNNGYVQQVEDPKPVWENQIPLTVPDRPGFTIPEKPVWQINPGPDANTDLFCTYSSLGIWNRQTQTLKRYPGGATSNPGNGVYAALADADMTIWAGTMDGLAKRVDTTWTKSSTATNGMSGNSVNSIMIDKSDNIITGGGSLMQFDGASTWQVWTVDRFNYVPVENVTLDSNGTYWATCNFGGGAGSSGAALYKRTGNNYQAQSISGFANLSPIVTANDGTVWVGGQTGVAKYDGTKWTVYKNSTSNLPEGKVNAIAADKNSNAVWLAMDFSGVVKFDGTVLQHFTTGDHPDMGSDQVLDVAVDRATGDVWIGTNGTGASHWNGTAWTNYNSSNSPLVNDVIPTITVDKYGATWMGTGGAGLVKFKGANWNIFSNENSGMQDDRVRSIGIDSQQRIWLGLGTNGMAMYDEQSVLGVEAPRAGVTAGRMLSANTPNPFTGSTMLRVNSTSRATTRVSVMDARGIEVAVLHSGVLDAGDHTMVFNADGLPNGVYFARVTSGAHVETQPMVLAR